MSVFKRRRVVMVPTTNERAPIVTFEDGSFRRPNSVEDHFKPDGYAELFLISDEKILSGDNVLSTKHHEGYNLQTVSESNVDLYNDSDHYFKIISTTDSSVRIVSNPDSRIHTDWHKLYAEPSRGFIQKFCDKGGIWEVMVEYEEVPTWENEINDGWKLRLKVSSDNTITIRPVKSGWTREEVVQLRREAFDQGVAAESLQLDFDLNKEKWLEDF